MSSLLKKLIIIVSVVLFILFISLLVAAWTMGMFAPVTVKEAERGPYYAVVIANKGSYRGISQKIDEVSEWLKSNRIQHSVACGIFYDDPTKINSADLKSDGGYLIKDSLEVSPPLRCLKFPVRSIGVASIKANQAIAGFKTYPALLDWIEKYNFTYDTLQPIIELYYDDGIVEVELPIITSQR